MSGRLGLSLVAGRLAFARGLARLPIAVLPLVIVAIYGADRATDCFFLVLAGVQFVTNAFAPLLETVVVPFIAEHRATARDAAFVRGILGRVVLYCTPLSAALAAAALVWHTAGWPAYEGWESGWRHLLALAWLPVLSALSSVFVGYLNAEEWFLWAASAGSVRGLVALGVGLLLGSRYGVFAYALGLLAGEVAALCWLARSTPGRRALAAAAIETAVLRPFWRLFASIVVGGVANSSKAFVDRFVAASLGAGAVSMLEAAERVFLMAVSFLGAPFATVVLSRWSAAFPDGSIGASDRLRTGLRWARPVALALGLTILCGYPVVTFGPVWSRLFGRFPVGDVPIVKLALLLYLAGAVPYLLGLITTQAILVVRDSAFVAAVSIAVSLLNVPFDLAGVRWLGLPGIALASSVLHTVGWLSAEWRLRRRASAVEGTAT